jgi:MarR family transcriptional regulator for hemolysin
VDHPDRSFGFLVHDVARLFVRRFNRNGHRLGLTRAQCHILGYLARNEGINQVGLADLLEIRPMTLVRHIDGMQDAGCIERRPDPADRRARRLFLTEQARPVLRRIWDVAAEIQDHALAPLSPDEADQLIDLLRRAHRSISLSRGVVLDVPSVRRKHRRRGMTVSRTGRMIGTSTTTH